MSLKFNDESKKPRFIYKPNPLAQRSFQIFEYKPDREKYEPVGDYTLIDLKEKPDITEKKLINLISLMNGRKPLISFENLTEERVLFNIESSETSDSSDKKHEKIVFRTYDGKGVSKENAVLTINKGVYDDFNSGKI